jgi:hypothetical protein
MISVSNRQESLVSIKTSWIYVAQNWDRWQAFVNVVLNLSVPQNSGKFFIS